MSLNAIQRTFQTASNSLEKTIPVLDMPINRARLRQLHTALVPFMALPLLLTLTTGILFQFAVASDHANDFIWLLELHRGKFGQINLDFIYPVLNGLGLLTLLITGIVMWLQSQRGHRKSF